MLRNILSGNLIANLLTCASWSATSKSTLLDRAGYQSAALVLALGANSGTAYDASNLVTVIPQESDTTADADFTDVVAADLLVASAVPTSNATVINSAGTASKVYAWEYRGSKRYIRLKLTETGTMIIPLTVLGVLGRPTSLPVSAPIAGTAST